MYRQSLKFIFSLQSIEPKFNTLFARGEFLNCDSRLAHGELGLFNAQHFLRMIPYSDILYNLPSVNL